MLNSAQMLRTVYDRIKREGSAVVNSSPRFGGIWSSDRWQLNGVIASLEDDGYTIAVMEGSKRASQTGSNDPLFSGGATAQWLSNLNGE